MYNVMYLIISEPFRRCKYTTITLSFGISVEHISDRVLDMPVPLIAVSPLTPLNV